MNREFADIYEGDPTFDAHAYASAGAPLVILKSTEGTGHIDSTHVARSERAHQAGLPVGHYHFAHPETNPVGQARFFWDHTRPHYRKLADFLAIDLEIGSPSLGPAWLRAFEHELLRYSTLHPEKLVAYAPLSYIQEAGSGLQVRSRRWWVAAWGPTVRSLGAGREVWAQQHTDSHAGPGPHGAAGIGPCDMSTLNPASTRLFDRVRGR